KALSWQRGDWEWWTTPVERWRFQTEFPTFPDLVTIDSITQLSHRYGDGDPVAVRPVGWLLRGYQLSVGYTPGPLLAVLVVLALAGLRRRPELLLFLAGGVLVLLAGAVLDTVPPKCCGLDVASLVVVDGATDGTADVARAHGAVTCVVPVNRGQGAALRLGYHLVAQRGARFVVTTDADGQYDMAELPA